MTHQLALIVLRAQLLLPLRSSALDGWPTSYTQLLLPCPAWCCNLCHPAASPPRQGAGAPHPALTAYRLTAGCAANVTPNTGLILHVTSSCPATTRQCPGPPTAQPCVRPAAAACCGAAAASAGTAALAAAAAPRRHAAQESHPSSANVWSRVRWAAGREAKHRKR